MRPTPNEGLTWEDDYYNDKEDIVAVFDVDGKTVSARNKLKTEDATYVRAQKRHLEDKSQELQRIKNSH